MDGWRSGQQREPRESRDYRDSRDSRDSRDFRDSRDSRDPRGRGRGGSGFTSNWRSSGDTRSRGGGGGGGGGGGFASSNWRNRDANTSQSEAAGTGSDEPSADSKPPYDNSNNTAEVTNRLYVANLLYTANPEDVTAVFEKNGFEFANINMSVDPMTGRNPSYCFVDMHTPEAAAEAMEALNGIEILGRPLKIKPAFPKEGGPGGGNQRMKASGGRWKERKGNDDYQPTFDRYKRNDSSQHWDAPLQGGRRLFVGGLPRMQPQSAVDEAMQDLFADFELDVVSKLIVPKVQETDVDSHYLFVDLVNKDDVDVCIRRLNGTPSPWGKGTLNVSRARDNRDRKVMREQNVPKDPW